jgi:hypothetical protein
VSVWISGFIGEQKTAAAILDFNYSRLHFLM